MKSPPDPQRRQFLKTTALASASAFTAPLIFGQEKVTKKYRTALIGTGWWGMNILGEAMRAGRSKIVGLCDVDQRYLNPAAARVEKETVISRHSTATSANCWPGTTSMRC